MDEDSWWASDLRTYDGQPTPDWITYRGPLFETPLGETYQGDVLLNSDDGNVPGTIEVLGLSLTVPDFGPDTGRSHCLEVVAVNQTVVADEVTAADSSSDPEATPEAKPASE